MDVKWIEGHGFDSNVFLIKEDTTLLIDAGTGLNFDWIREKLSGFGVTPEDIDILINTHCHFDHAGGDPDFINSSRCKLMASEPAAKALRNADEITTLAANFGKELEPLEVSQLLNDGEEIDLGETKLTVLSTPGHTRGSISLYEPREKALFSGDAVFRGGVGRMDLPTSDPEAMKNSLRRLKEMEVDKLYPGHGPIAEENGRRHIESALNLLV